MKISNKGRVLINYIKGDYYLPLSMDLNFVSKGTFGRDTEKGVRKVKYPLNMSVTTHVSLTLFTSEILKWKEWSTTQTDESYLFCENISLLINGFECKNQCSLWGLGRRRRSHSIVIQLPGGSNVTVKGHLRMTSRGRMSDKVRVHTCTCTNMIKGISETQNYIVFHGTSPLRRVNVGTLLFCLHRGGSHGRSIYVLNRWPRRQPKVLRKRGTGVENTSRVRRVNKLRWDGIGCVVTFVQTTGKCIWRVESRTPFVSTGCRGRRW